jgi:hypothetical protein
LHRAGTVPAHIKNDKGLLLDAQTYLLYCLMKRTGPHHAVAGYAWRSLFETIASPVNQQNVPHDVRPVVHQELAQTLKSQQLGQTASAYSCFATNTMQ